MSSRCHLNSIPSIVNPFAIQAYNQSREHNDVDIRRMVKDEFLNVFMEITQVGIEACEDFRTVNMYHIANSDAVHDYIRDISSFEVLTSESSARANRYGVSIVAVNGVDIMKKSVYYGMSKPFDYLDPDTWPLDRRPMWLPRFRRMHICDAICLYMEDMMTASPVKTVQSDTYFSKLRHLDEQDDFLSVDGYAPLKRIKVFNMFPEMFWKIFCEIFPPYDLQGDMSLGLLIRPEFNDECKDIFDTNVEKGRKKFINVSRTTKNILDRMILGFDNIHHDVNGSSGPFPFGTDPAVLYDIIHSRSSS
jgi:hypothetical protein